MLEPFRDALLQWRKHRRPRRRDFAARACVGVPDPDPIFVVGLPRSGSTLIEQTLASHSQVEGTQELVGPERPDRPRYPRAVPCHLALEQRRLRRFPGLTSVVQFIEKRFGVFERNISPWRRAVAGEISNKNLRAVSEPNRPAVSVSLDSRVRFRYSCLKEAVHSRMSQAWCD